MTRVVPPTPSGDLFELARAAPPPAPVTATPTERRWAPYYLQFALKWHDAGQFRLWLLALRTRAAVGTSLVSFLEATKGERRKQPSGGYSAVVLLRAAVLARWILPRRPFNAFDPPEKELVANVYALNPDNESLSEYLSPPTKAAA